MKRSLARAIAVALFFALGVAVVRFTSPARVVVTWETATEVNTAGFLLHRGTLADGPFVQIVASPLPSRGDPLIGASYRYEDEEVVWGQRYFYQLEEVEDGGGRHRYPEVVEGRAGWGWPSALVAGALLATLAAVFPWRRLAQER